MLIQVDELSGIIGKPEVLVIDCRFDLPGPHFDPCAGCLDYQAGHIPGAYFLDLEKDLSGDISPSTGRHPLPKWGDFIARMEGIGLTKSRQVVIYDDSGSMLAARLWWMLKHWLGHRSVYVLDGGYGAWCAENMAVTLSLPQAVNTRADYCENKEALLSLSQVRLIVEGREAGLLVDARAPRRFSGEEEPVDPVAGHIPGAVNIPAGENIGPDKKFLPAAVLKQRFEGFVQQADSAQNIVHYCGSGVTACHNLLAMELAGLSHSKLYAGSWSEWIREKEHPVAIGES